MRTYLLAGFALLAATAQVGAAQQRRYLVELGAAGAYQSFDNATDLGGAAGGVARVGVWLPLNFSLELEGGISSPKTQTGNEGVSVKTISGAALYNVPIGRASSFYLKGGIGSTKYGSDCPSTASPGDPICGSSGALLAGLGFRAAVTPTIMIRTEGLYNRNRSTPQVPAAKAVTLSNFGVNVGVSLMVGSRPILDEDGDGVLDNRDRCPDTPAGASVDGRGCSQDTDNDGVPDGVDRCPSTIAGAAVDVRGCSQDSDGDNIPNGLDKCPDSPQGVLVDPRGCPRDSDGDKIPDGLDRCSDTPRGATVDALGCPGDEDGDGVLDGLDRCPRTAVGAAVDASGCATGQQPSRPEAATPTPADTARRPPRIQPDTVGRPVRRPNVRVPISGAISAGVLPDVGFVPGTARLQPSSYAALDSIADLLLAAPRARVEIGAHTDNSGSSSDDLRITSLQAEAVRDYLVVKGVNYQQVVPRGYGSSVPLTPDTTPRGRAANRRVEIRPIQPGP
jgi:outer membrane protein OmpA-like peptidoglycan-associated protein